MKAESKKLIQFDWAMKHLLRRKANFPILEGFSLGAAAKLSQEEIENILNITIKG